jgi:hypothetical protein
MDAPPVAPPTAGMHMQRVVSFGGLAAGQYALAEVAGSRPDRVLIPLADVARRPEYEIDSPADVIRVPQDVSPETAVLIPILAEALRVWDGLDTEIGAAAVVTHAAPWSDLLTEVGTWYGARPSKVAIGTPAGGEPAVDISDPDAVARFRQRLEAYPLVCAVELTGRAAAAEFYFESMPQQARVLLAGPPYEHLTIDYYVNVHRKGLRLRSTVLTPRRSFSGDDSLERVRRATRLLSHAGRVNAVQAAVGPHVEVTPA